MPTEASSRRRIQSAIWSASTWATGVSPKLSEKSACSSAFASSADFARRSSSENSVGCCSASSVRTTDDSSSATAAFTASATLSASNAVPTVSARTTNRELPPS